MRKNFNTTIDEETIAAIERLAVNGKSKGAVVDEAVALLVSRSKVVLPDEATVNRWFRETWSRLDEIHGMMDAVASLGAPGPEPRENLAARAAAAAKAARERADPATIPGVQRGLPPRESSAERAARERREREERARNLDKTGGNRDDIDRSDEYVSN